MRVLTLCVVSAVLSALLSPVLMGQTKPCSDEKSHQFDFWIGEWEVYADGVLAGRNSIRPILDGCVLQENWEGVKGSKGSSLNFYNPVSGKWEQFWVWRNGSTLELSGGYQDQKMILEGEARSPSGTTVQNRITWFNNDEGSVRQLWEVSEDQGASWKIVFDGLYRRKR